MSISNRTFAWPALQLRGERLPHQLVYERGVWGKVHGASSDYRWIATTAALAAPRKRLDLELALGLQDTPATATLWRVLGDTCYAVSFYPSRAIDAAGRSGFLEKQVVEWKRPPELPAALGALLFLPKAATFDSSIYWQKLSDARWQEHDYMLDLDASTYPPLPVSETAVEQAIASGLRDLRAMITEETLAETYASLLAGNRGVSLRGLKEPLTPEALAVLLLPLPREIADRLSVMGWLPSSRLEDESIVDLQHRWDLILGGTVTLSGGAPTAPTEEQNQRASAMARRIFAGSPGESTSQTSDSLAEASEAAQTSIRLTLWGPSQAGKTVLLANLYLETEDENWDVFPTEKSINFIQDMRGLMQTSNVFPGATVEAPTVGRIEYLFRHRQSGASASLEMEDRAGAESETLKDEPDGDSGKTSLKKRLGSADGLVLVFDPTADRATLNALVWRTLEIVHVSSGRGTRKDDRPIAVCVSKADVLIETADDFRNALDSPDKFVREHVSRDLVRALDRLCGNYRLFPVSAVGVRLRRGVIEPAVFFDENLSPRICHGGRAFNLMTPFSWLLGQLSGQQ